MNSSTVSAWDQALAAQYNNLRKDLIVQAWEYAVTTWSANAYILAIDAQYVAYTAWDNFEFKTNFSNTWSATVNVNSLWAKTLKDPEWNTLGSGAIPSGSIIKCVYNWTDMICYGWILATASNKWMAEMLTDAEAKAKTDTTRYVNASQLAFIAPNNQAIQTYAFSALPASFSIAHGLWVAPTSVKVRTISDKFINVSVQEFSTGSYKSGAYNTLYVTTSAWSPPSFLSYGVSTTTISQFSAVNNSTTDDLIYTMTISSIDATNINFAITRTLWATVSGRVWFLIDFVL